MTEHHWGKDLFEELKRRRVIRVATLYVVAFWPFIQVVDILSPALSLPDSAMRYLVVAFVTGLPIVLILAWIFDLNQGGLVRDTGDSAETGPALIGSKTEIGVIFFMLIVAAALLYVQVTTDDGPLPIAGGDTPSARSLTSAVSKRSIAVLPFEVFSDDPRDRFFADGLTEEMLNVLARVSGLEVAARTSSFAYRDSRKLPMEIARELDVGVILEGSVRRNDIDNTIRVTAQLIDATTGTHYFSRTFDRKFSDVFKIQDEIAALVVDELKVTLLGDEIEGMKSHASASAEALITYSMGQAELAKRTQVAMQDSVRFFKKALEEDPNYAEAWVGLADAHTLIASYDFGDSEENLIAAQAAVDKALALDPRSGMAWASQGLIYRNRHEIEKAKATFVKALELNPNYPMAHMWYGGLLEDEEVKFGHFERAYKLDPKSPVAGYNVARMLIDRGRESDAMQVFSKIIEADPFYPRAYDLVAIISLNRGRLLDGIRQFEKAYELQPNTQTAYDIAHSYNSLGNFTVADEWIARAKPNEPPERLYIYDQLELQRYAMQGDATKLQQVLTRIAKPWRENEVAYLMSTIASYLMGDFKRATQSWERSREFRDDPNDKTSFSRELYLFAHLGAAYSYAQIGDVTTSKEMIQVVREKMASESRHGDSGSNLWFEEAFIEAVDGNRQMALINLQRAINEGYRQYWYPKIDPAFQSLSDGDELQTLLAGLETQIRLMRDQLAFEQSFAAAPTDRRTGS